MRASPTLHGRRVATVTRAATLRQRIARVATMATTGASFAILFLVIATDWRL